jgi:hypothetical protein
MKLVVSLLRKKSYQCNRFHCTRSATECQVWVLEGIRAASTSVERPASRSGGCRQLLDQLGQPADMLKLDILA